MITHRTKSLADTINTLFMNPMESLSNRFFIRKPHN